MEFPAKDADADKSVLAMRLSRHHRTAGIAKGLVLGGLSSVGTTLLAPHAMMVFFPVLGAVYGLALAVMYWGRVRGWIWRSVASMGAGMVALPMALWAMHMGEGLGSALRFGLGGGVGATLMVLLVLVVFPTRGGALSHACSWWPVLVAPPRAACWRRATHWGGWEG